MSIIDAALVRAADAEEIAVGAARMTLLADAAQTGGAVNACRTRLPPGATGAPPHHHRSAAEAFFVLDGVLRALAGDRLHTLAAGDFLLVPRGVPHAFAAAADAAADVLLVFTPGIAERFGYFRLAADVLRGRADPAEVLATQERYDNHFVDSPLWPGPRAPRPGTGWPTVARSTPVRAERDR